MKKELHNTRTSWYHIYWDLNLLYATELVFNELWLFSENCASETDFLASVPLDRVCLMKCKIKQGEAPPVMDGFLCQLISFIPCTDSVNASHLIELSYLMQGSGWAVASDTEDAWFESHHQQVFQIYLLKEMWALPSWLIYSLLTLKMPNTSFYVRFGIDQA